jgi:SAM-dependent methyltransferase
MSNLIYPKYKSIICPLCGPQSGKAILSKASSFQIYACPKCRLGQTVPYPEESNGQEYYTNSDEHFANQYANGRIQWHKYMGSLLDHAKPYVSSGSILDIGTGIGFMLEVAKERGFNETTGIEPSPAAGRYSREKLGLNIIQGHFPSPALHGQQFNLITLSHVLEHVPEPLVFLQAIKEYLKPGGVAVITAPAYNGLIVRVIQHRWYGFQPTQHIWQLTPKIVANMCKTAGLEVLKVSSESMDHGKGTSLRSLIFRFLAFIGAKLNLGDQLLVIVRNN